MKLEQFLEKSVFAKWLWFVPENLLSLHLFQLWEETEADNRRLMNEMTRVRGELQETKYQMEGVTRKVASIFIIVKPSQLKCCHLIRAFCWPLLQYWVLVWPTAIWCYVVMLLMFVIQYCLENVVISAILFPLQPLLTGLLT